MTDSTPPLVPTVTFEFEGENYTAVADHMMIVRYERLAGQSFGHMLLHMEEVTLIGALPKFSEFAFMLQAMLAENHPEIGLDVAMKMVGAGTVMDSIATLISGALPTGKGDNRDPLVKAAKSPRPRKKSGTGKH